MAIDINYRPQPNSPENNVSNYLDPGRESLRTFKTLYRFKKNNSEILLVLLILVILVFCLCFCLVNGCGYGFGLDGSVDLS